MARGRRRRPRAPHGALQHRCLDATGSPHLLRLLVSEPLTFFGLAFCFTYELRIFIRIPSDMRDVNDTLTKRHT